MELVFKHALLDLSRMLINVNYALMEHLNAQKSINNSSTQLHVKVVLLWIQVCKFRLIIKQVFFRNAFRIVQLELSKMEQCASNAQTLV